VLDLESMDRRVQGACSQVGSREASEAMEPLTMAGVWVVSLAISSIDTSASWSLWSRWRWWLSAEIAASMWDMACDGPWCRSGPHT